MYVCIRFDHMYSCSDYSLLYMYSCLGGTSSAAPCRAGTFNDAERSTSILACKVTRHCYYTCMYSCTHALHHVYCRLALVVHSVTVAQQTAVTTHPSHVLWDHTLTSVMELPLVSSVNRVAPVPMEAYSGYALRGSLLLCLGPLIAPYVLMDTSA